MAINTELLNKLLSLYAPSGHEMPARIWLETYLRGLGYTTSSDSKGNVMVKREGDPSRPAVLVTAHLDEIALMVTDVTDDGKILVTNVGGSYPWKWGEGEMEILTYKKPVPAILSFGCIHTNHPESVVEHARTHALKWDHAYLFTGRTKSELQRLGVHAGLRVVIPKSRRGITSLNEYLCAYFLDDRAALLIWLMALEALRDIPTSETPPLLFAATTSEEVGGLGACHILQNQKFPICVALEISPKTPEANFPIDATPTIWVKDGYAAMEAIDGEILEECASSLDIAVTWQYLSRGGSDASCAAALGLTARPVTIGFPVENSHGFEIMHSDAPETMLRLLLNYLQKVR